MKKTRKKFIKIFLAIIIIILFTGVTIFLYQFYNYKQGEKFQENKEYDKAISYYQKIKFVYDKAKNNEQECYYQRAIELRNEEDYDNSILYFEKSNNYNDSQEQIKETMYKKAMNKYENGDFEKSKEIFKTIQEYKNVSEYLSNNEIMLDLQGIWQDKNDLTNWIYEINGWKLNVYSEMSIGSYIIENENFYRLPGNFSIEINDNEISKVLDGKKSTGILNYDKNAKIITDDVGTFIKQPHYKVTKIEIKEPSIGMTKNEVLNSTWGEPEDINRTTTRYGTSEQWCYNGNKYIYFEDGIVTSIQD